MDDITRIDLKQSLNLFNGIATLTISIPANAKVGDIYFFETEILDEFIDNKITNSFKVIIEKEEDYKSGGNGGKRKSVVKNNNRGKKKQNGFAIPEIIPVKKEEWGKYEMNQYSALYYVSTYEGEDYYLNMDNTYLLTELKGLRDKNKIELTKARFIYSMALIAMSVVGYCKKNKGNDKEDISNQVSKITTMVAPILIPMLESMSNLSIQPTNA